jgi:leucyl/phenylalanyl-tRNA--protein transferase
MPAPYWLDPNDTLFPDVELALRDPDGLLAVGGDLSVERLLAGYQRGIFPWYSPGQPILWWSPDPRSILLPGSLKISRSLRKTLRKRCFEITLDHDFKAVIEACAEPRPEQQGTWIVTEMQAAYLDLHKAGYAHSVEAWQDGKLVGGLYGVAIGRVFFGESMFARVSDASKVAFAHLTHCLRIWGFQLIDCQVQTRHLDSLGANRVTRHEFTKMLSHYCPQPGHVGNWDQATCINHWSDDEQ